MKMEELEIGKYYYSCWDTGGSNKWGGIIKVHMIPDSMVGGANYRHTNLGLQTKDGIPTENELRKLGCGTSNVWQPAIQEQINAWNQIYYGNIAYEIY